MHRKNDPYPSFNFVIEIDGMTAGFSEVSGVGTETDIVEYREGNDDAIHGKIPGLHKLTNITFKRGYTNSQDLWNWYQDVVGGKSRRLSGTFTQFDEHRNPAAVWKFDKSWPLKLEAPAFNAKSNDVMIETLELAVEGLTLEYPPDRP